MCTYEIKRAVTDEIVCVDIDKRFKIQNFKLVNKLTLDRYIEQDAEMKLKVLNLVPEFDLLVRSYEYKWKKHRSRFTLAERDEIMKEFRELKKF